MRSESNMQSAESLEGLCALYFIDLGEVLDDSCSFVDLVFQIVV